MSAVSAGLAAGIVGAFEQDQEVGVGGWVFLGALFGAFYGACGGVVTGAVCALVAEIADARRATTPATYGNLAAIVTAVGSLLVTSFFALIWSGGHPAPAVVAGWLVLSLAPTVAVTLAARVVGRWMWGTVRPKAMP